MKLTPNTIQPEKKPIKVEVPNHTWTRLLKRKKYIVVKPDNPAYGMVEYYGNKTN
jgi:hypothetical protein